MAVRFVHIFAALSLLAIAGVATVYSEDIRLANGVIVKGDVVGSSPDGLQIQTPAGTKVYSWETLSMATRYRHQPVFRANLDPVLRGLPPHARTNKPDPGSIVAPPKPAAPAPVQPKEDAPAAAADDASRLFDNVEYEHVISIASPEFPGATLRSPAYASYVGFQYGLGKDEVLYFAFDTKGQTELSDILFVYGPGAPEFKTTQRIAGFKKGSGSARYVSYRKLKTSAQFGSITASFEIEPETTGLMTNELTMTISVELSRGNSRSRFTLNQRFTDLLHGEGLIPVKGVLDLPTLWLTIDTVDGAHKLAGNLNMSNMKLVPRDGMDNRVAIVVSDSDDNAVMRENVKLDVASFPLPYGVVCELKRLEPDSTYNVNATIDLGPFFGPAEFSDEITTPKVLKP